MPNYEAELKKRPTIQVSENRTDSETTMSLSDKWFLDCLTSHKGCKKTSVATKMPTRLLNITAEHVQLYTTDVSKPPVPYATLSHCWGSAKFLKLTAETSQRLLDGVTLCELPQTFRDAVCVAKRLKIENIWIDSLCIFQDSESDFQLEASTMAGVYRGAACNIAATASSNSSGGCFRTRDPALMSPCIFTTEYVDQTNDTYHLMEVGYIDSFLYEDQPLLTRGWVVQERILAQRVLHFGEQQAFWECHEDIYCEAYPSGIPNHAPNPVSAVGNGAILPLKMLEPLAGVVMDTEISDETKANLHIDIYDFWEHVVRIYMQCKLTKEGDKLVAMAGIAKEIHRSLGSKDRYLAGLWRNNLFAQLLWYRWGRDNIPAVRPKVYRAPTWSWASLDTDITFTALWKPIFVNTLVSFDIKTLSPDEFGQVTHGSIRVKGPLKTVTSTMKQDHISSYAGPFEWEFKSVEIWEVRGGPYAYWDIPHVPDESCLTYENREVLRLHFMPCFARNPDQRRDISGLILQPTGLAKGQFRRLGLLTIGSQAPRPDMSSYGAADSGGEDSWLEYEEFDGTYYTISII